MTRCAVRFMFLLVAGCFCLARPVSAEPASSTQLIADAAKYDNQRVSFQGEAIGDIMARGGYCWVNVNDGVNAIGIWVAKNITESISLTGSYKVIGDTVAVEGIFHRACPEHGGDMDIHAEAFSLLASGHRVAERPDTQKKQTAVALAGVLCLVVILQILKKK